MCWIWADRGCARCNKADSLNAMLRTVISAGLMVFGVEIVVGWDVYGRARASGNRT